MTLLFSSLFDVCALLRSPRSLANFHWFLCENRRPLSGCRRTCSVIVKGPPSWRGYRNRDRCLFTGDGRLPFAILGTQIQQNLVHASSASDFAPYRRKISLQNRSQSRKQSGRPSNFYVITVGRKLSQRWMKAKRDVFAPHSAPFLPRSRKTTYLRG